MLFGNFKNYNTLRYVVYGFLKKVLGGPRPTCLVRVHCALQQGIPLHPRMQYEEDPRPACQYGTDCYRTNPQHKQKYKHLPLPGQRSREPSPHAPRELSPLPPRDPSPHTPRGPSPLPPMSSSPHPPQQDYQDYQDYQSQPASQQVPAM